MPTEAPRDWKGVMTSPKVPENNRGALLLPIEGHRWHVSVGELQGEEPPGDVAGFMAYLQQLRTPTIYEAVQHAQCLGAIARWRFPQSVYWHYERLASFPRGLLPLGDAICCFNPVYGQGMSVAAQEAQRLGQLLAERATMADPLDGLAQLFFAQAAELIETPWAMASMADLALSGTRGERPPDFEQRQQMGRAMAQLAAQDPAVHKLMAEVTSLLKPRSVYQDPALMERLREVMAAQ
jgi:2-polyprenyl-6-methoxyphenol hydroxylase-like FAD-dependent oxidoreductase